MYFKFFEGYHCCIICILINAILFPQKKFQKKKKKILFPFLTKKAQQQGSSYQKAFRNLFCAKIELVGCRFKGLHKITQIKRHLWGLASPALGSESWWMRQGAQHISQILSIFKDAIQMHWLFMASTRKSPPSPHAPPIPSYSNCFPACLSSASTRAPGYSLPQVQDSMFPVAELHSIPFYTFLQLILWKAVQPSLLSISPAGFIYKAC